MLLSFGDQRSALQGISEGLRALARGSVVEIPYATPEHSASMARMLILTERIKLLGILQWLGIICKTRN